MKKYLLYAKRALLFALAILILLGANEVLMRKRVSGDANYQLKVGGFKNEPAQSFDVIGLGSSHMYCSLSPVVLYKNTGLRAYVYSTQRQAAPITYHFLKEVYKTQSPKVIILEDYIFLFDEQPPEAAALHDAADYFPRGLNRLGMIKDTETDEEKISFVFPIIKYHTRWSSLTKEDFDFSFKKKTDPYHGYVFLTKIGESGAKQINYGAFEPEPLEETAEIYLEKIVELAKENGSSVVLLTAPFTYISDRMAGRIKTLKAYAEENDCGFLDFNEIYNDSGLVTDYDFFDDNHVNVYGTAKTTSRIAAYLVERYGDFGNGYTGDEADWAEDIAQYDERYEKALDEALYVLDGVRYDLPMPRFSSLENTETGVKLQWEPMDGVERYRLFYKDSDAKSWTRVGDTKDTEYLVTDLEPGHTYSFTFRCVSSDGKENISKYNMNGKSILYQPKKK